MKIIIFILKKNSSIQKIKQTIDKSEKKTLQI
jgi:hypothetical protein